MHKKIREGVDIKVALASQMKRISNVNESNSPEPSQDTSPVAESPRSVIGRLLRPPFRAVKFVLRPFTSRIRWYLIQPLLQESQLSRITLQQEIQAHRTSLQQEIQAHRASLQQELYLTRTSLQQEMLPRLDRIEKYSLATARREAVNCGPEEVLVRTEVGYILCSSRDHAVLVCLLETGELERGTRLLLQQLLKPGDVFIDVGANLGLHTIAAARAMEGRGHIVAFEPFEPTKRLLEKSIWMNGFSGIVEIHQAAVSSHAGHQRLYLGVTSGHHSLFPLSVPSGMKEQPVDVPLVMLDGILADTPVVNLIKIDVEGAELEVLEGAKSVIARNKEIAVIVEFGPSHLGRTGQTTQDWFSHFEALGLVHRVINRETGVLETWSIEKLKNVESVNLLMARPEAQVWRKAETS